MQLIDLISNFSILAPTVVGAILVKRYNSIIRTLYAWIVCTFIIETIILYTSYNQINNLVLFHIYTYLEFGFISAIYIQLITTRSVKITVYAISGAFLTFSVFNLIQWEWWDQFNSNQTLFEALFVIALVFAHMVHLLKALDIKNLATHPYYWLSIGLFLYFAVNFVLFLTMRYVDGEQIRSFWTVHSVMNIILKGVFTLVLWLSRKL